MNIIQALKGPKHMSINHWRFRLIHWIWGEKNVIDYNSTKLPSFLYTSYCPLFHFSNAMVVLLPFIVLLMGVSRLWRGVVGLWNLVPLPPETSTKITDEEREFETLMMLIKRWHATRARRLSELNDVSNNNDFEDFWAIYDSRFSLLTKEKATEFFTRCYGELEQRRLDREAADQRRKDMVIWICNMSHWLFKGCLSIGYWILMAIFIITVGLVLYWLCTGLWGFLAWLASEPGLIRQWLIFAIALVVLTSGGLFVMTRPWIRQKLPGIDGAIAKMFITPALWFWLKMFVPLCTMLVNILTGIGEFCNVFYENNCPTIVLDDDTDGEE